jgi:DNA-binding FrmR family transcriptional regulator
MNQQEAVKEAVAKEMREVLARVLEQCKYADRLWQVEEMVEEELKKYTSA